jgi:hypothetical protein
MKSIYDYMKLERLSNNNIYENIKYSRVSRFKSRKISKELSFNSPYEYLFRIVNQRGLKRIYFKRKFGKKNLQQFIKDV